MDNVISPILGIVQHAECTVYPVYSLSTSVQAVQSPGLPFEVWTHPVLNRCTVQASNYNDHHVTISSHVTRHVTHHVVSQVMTTSVRRISIGRLLKGRKNLVKQQKHETSSCISHQSAQHGNMCANPTSTRRSNDVGLKSAEIILYKPWRPKVFFNLKSS